MSGLSGRGRQAAPQYRRANRSARCIAYQRHFASLPTSRRLLLTSPCLRMVLASCEEHHTIARGRGCGFRQHGD
jgi:hypothetical protein